MNDKTICDYVVISADLAHVITYCVLAMFLLVFLLGFVRILRRESETIERKDPVILALKKVDDEVYRERRKI